MVQRLIHRLTIIAAGPKKTSAVAFGEVFRTSHPDHVTFQLNDKFPALTRILLSSM